MIIIMIIIIIVITVMGPSLGQSLIITAIRRRKKLKEIEEFSPAVMLIKKK